MPDKNSPDKPFPIVAFGGSAGAIEAVIEIVESIPTHTGMAYIYLQHQNPDVESKLSDVISKKAKMPVLLAENDMAVEPDFFYVIPPGMEATITDGLIHLSQRKEEYDHMPVNHFFSSLADSNKEFAIGVLLSGADSDGTLGLKAIKMGGGITIAQDETAQFRSMPKSAIAEGAVDLVLSPKQIAEELQNLSRQQETFYQALQDVDKSDISYKDEDLQAVIQMVQAAVGVDFTQYKMTTIKRRIIRRMAIHKQNTLKEYVQFIREHANEAQQLFNDLLINVTTFFRDPELSEYLKAHVLPELVKSKKHNEPIRVWVPACSTGQEVYSLAILLIEVLGEQYTHVPIHIFATDLSEAAINKARLGIYTKGEVEGLAPKRLQRFFTKIDGGYRIIKSIRDLCVFATHNIAKDPPFTRLDIISCCNVLIYIDTSLQKKVIHTFHYALNNHGYLILGKSETVGNLNHLFTQVEKKIKIYAKKKDIPSKVFFDMHYHLPSGNKGAAAGNLVALEKMRSDESDLEAAVDHLLLKRFTPASVVVDHEMDIVQFRGSTGLFLEPTPGKASLNLLKMARPGLGFELRSAIHKCQKNGEVVKRAGIEMNVNGALKSINIEVIPIKSTLQEPYYLIAFEEAPPLPLTDVAAIKDKRVKQLEAELSALQEDMRSIIESQEAANEELQSANEEIISSNEELQSINEELETSKEELESSNEELVTINQELQLRNEQLVESEAYAEAVFSTIRESLLILDRNLRVKRANFSFYKTFHLREDQTEGRLIYDLNQKQWDIPKLRELLENLLPESNQVQGFEIVHQFSGLGEKTLVLNVQRINQKVHAEQLVLLAIEDITEHRRAQKIIEDRELWFRNLADNAPVMIWVTDKDKKSTFFNKAWLEFRDISIEEALRKGWTDGVHPDDLPKVVKKFNDNFGDKLPFEFKYRVLHNDKEYLMLHNKAKPNFTPEGQFLGYIGSCVVIKEVLDGE